MQAIALKALQEFIKALITIKFKYKQFILIILNFILI
jgi:hypothetical protein